MPNAASRFIYDAKAVGVGVRVQALEEAWAACALPVIGGRASAQHGSVNHTFFGFNSAETVLTGQEVAAGVFQTDATVTVKGLTILKGVLIADCVSVSVRWTYNRGNNRRSMQVLTPNPFQGLHIRGNGGTQNYDDVALEQELAAGVGDRAALRAELVKRRNDQHHNKGGLSFTSLARGNNKLRSDRTEHGVVIDQVPGIDQIYFCEWSAGPPERQNLTALRVKLANPAGEIVICDPGTNGEDYP